MPQPQTWENCLEYAALTDVGMRRANNQDSHRVMVAENWDKWNERGHLFMVADGMGAHAAGELASKLTCDGIAFRYLKFDDESPPEALQRAFRETNAEVHRRGQANAEFHNMGTTGSVLLLLPQGAVVGHVGDSRIYRLRGDRLNQLTFDHSLVWELRAAGQVPEGSELGKSLPKNVITRSIGPNAHVQVDIEGPIPIELGDTFLLCSDGLTGQVKDEELGPLMAVLPPHEVVQVLVDLANLRGGPDNITVVVAKVTCEKLTTRGNHAEPLTVGGEKQERKLSPVLTSTIGVCGLATLVLLLIQPILAAVTLVAGAIAGAVAAWQWLRRPANGISLSEGRRLGKGPYTNTVCPANKEFVTRLAAVIKELTEVAREKKWKVNWERLEAYSHSAESAARSKDYPVALREYSHAISFMMQELRNQHSREGSDSKIEY